MTDPNAEPDTFADFETVLSAVMVAALDVIKTALTDMGQMSEDETDRRFFELYGTARRLVELVDRLPDNERPADWMPLRTIEPAAEHYGQPIGWTPRYSAQPPIIPAMPPVEPGAPAGPGGCHGVMRVFGKESGNTVLHPRRCAEIAIEDTDWCEIHTPAPAGMVAPPAPPSVTEQIAREVIDAHGIDLEKDVVFTENEMIIMHHSEPETAQTTGDLAVMGVDGEWRTVGNLTADRPQ